jgi:methylmalonyl-CoA/ethylmalonyl-CoA epimerase
LIFDHIGVIAPRLETGRKHLALLGVGDWTVEFRDEGIGVYVQFGRDASNVCYEIVAPLGETSPVSQALKDRRAIINHVAYRVRDLAQEAERLRSQGCFVVGAPQPAVAYGGARVQFFVTPLRMIVELVEAEGHAHGFGSAA